MFFYDSLNLYPISENPIFRYFLFHIIISLHLAMTTTSRLKRKSHAYNDTDLNTKPGTHSKMFWPATGPPRWGGGGGYSLRATCALHAERERLGPFRITPRSDGSRTFLSFVSLRLPAYVMQLTNN